MYILGHTRKYPLRGYILGVLTHTTALEQLWGGDETPKCGVKKENSCICSTRATVRNLVRWQSHGTYSQF